MITTISKLNQNSRSAVATPTGGQGFQGTHLYQQLKAQFNKLARQRRRPRKVYFTDIEGQCWFIDVPAPKSAHSFLDGI